MALLDTLLSAFKGGAHSRVPLSDGYFNHCAPLF
jgi:hypothetical protein